MKTFEMTPEEVYLLRIAIQNQIYFYDTALKGPGSDPEKTRQKIETLETALNKLSQ